MVGQSQYKGGVEQLSK